MLGSNRQNRQQLYSHSSFQRRQADVYSVLQTHSFTMCYFISFIAQEESERQRIKDNTNDRPYGIHKQCCSRIRWPLKGVGALLYLGQTLPNSPGERRRIGENREQTLGVCDSEQGFLEDIKSSLNPFKGLSSFVLKQAAPTLWELNPPHEDC